MKIKIISIFIFLIILQAKSDEIYNLIQIPNLEVHKLKNNNGVKYLKAKKPFQIGIRNDNVTCFNPSNKTIKKKFNIIEKNINKYNSDFLKKINLKYVVMCENLTVSQIEAAGVPNHKMKTLIIDLKFNKNYFERIIHHEIFHIINDSYKNYFDENKWASFNPRNFLYAKCSTCSDRLNLSDLKKTNGFLTEYSMSTASEDMAEVFSFLMKDKKNLEKKSLNDPTLKKKISFIEKNILKIDDNFTFE